MRFLWLAVAIGCFFVSAPSAWAQLVLGRAHEENAAALARARADLAAQPPSQVASGEKEHGSPANSQSEVRENMLPREIAVLQILDKVSARTTQLRVPVNTTAMFGLLVVEVKSCQSAPPSEAPESAAFLEINEIDVNSLPRSGNHAAYDFKPTQRLLYSGWMFASSPALAAMENPVYDVRVIACESRQDAASPAGVVAPPVASSLSPGQGTEGEAADMPED